MRRHYSHLLIFSLFITSPLHCLDTPKIQLEIASDPCLNADPSEVVYICVMVNNPSALPFQDQLHLIKPEGWQCFPSEEISLEIQPNDSKLLIFGVKLPACTLACDQKIHFKWKDSPEDCPSVNISINRLFDLKSTVSGACEAFPLNERVQLSICYQNFGNSPLNVILDAKSEPNCSLQYIQEAFEIPAFGSAEVPFWLYPATTSLNQYSQFLCVRLIDQESGEELAKNPISLNFVDTTYSPDDPYVRIPCYLKTMVLGDRDQRLAAFECAGGGLIDQESQRYLDFCLRLPSAPRHVLYNVDQRIYFGIRDHEWDLAIGDTVYELSPLTQGYRYGRGLGVQKFSDSFGAGIHYTQNTLDCTDDPRELCSYIEWYPSKNCTLAANYLHKVQYETPTSQIVSIQAELDLTERVSAEIEFGKNLIGERRHRDTKAFRFETHGYLFEDSRFSLEKIYAGADFCGFYNHLHLFSSSLDLSVAPQFRLNLNTNRIKQNFDPNLIDSIYTIIPRQHQYGANLIYEIDPQCSLAANGLLLRGEDNGDLKQYDFYQKWVGCSLFVSSWGYQLNGIASFGQQNDYLTKLTTHGLQRYYLFLNRELSDALSASLFYDGGSINYYDPLPWRSAFGGTLSYRFTPRSHLQIFIQRVKQTTDILNMWQFAAYIDHSFKNSHKLQLEAQYYHYKTHFSNDLTCILSYSIPFSLPVALRKDIGELGGMVINPQDGAPIKGALVSCGERHASTSHDGRFSFGKVPIGQYQPTIDRLPGNLIAAQKNLPKVNVSGGKRRVVPVEVITACTISGEILLFGYKDLLEMLRDPDNAEMIPQEGLGGVRVAISLEGDKEIYSTSTNKNGAFSFPKLRPGHWHLKIYTDQLPHLHKLDANDLILEVSPGEEKTVLFKVLPKPPEIYKIDS